MGKPIKIIQMDKDLIRLSGLEPEVDIPIVYTGLRPGEKLYEELQLSEEKKVFTSIKRIMILKDDKSIMKWEVLRQSINTLISNSENLNYDEIQVLLQHLLPAYQPRSIQQANLEKNKSTYGLKIEA